MSLHLFTKYNFIKLALVVSLLLGMATLESMAQEGGVKSNLLYDATATVNFGGEFRMGNRQTIDLSGNLNLWAWTDNRKMKHWLLQPEWRYWLCSPFNRSFVGIHVHGGQFNFGGMLPWGFSDGKMFGIENSNIARHRYEGWLIGAGISYGYHWILSNRWNLEASVGLGYAYLDYSKYACQTCGQKLKDDHRGYFGPTKAALSLVYLIK